VAEMTLGRRIANYAIVLTVVCVAAGASLGWIYGVVKPRMDANAKARVDAGMRAIFSDIPDAAFEAHTATLDGGRTVAYTSALKDGTVAGYALMGESRGYSSTVKVLVRVNADATRVDRIMVTESAETPGLGERIKEVKSTNTLVGYAMGRKKDESGLRPWFQVQFDDRPVAQLVVVKGGAGQGVDAITGATVTSTAVTTAVKGAVAAMQAVLAQPAAGQPAGEDKP
jgi:Na+-translocating ferredoxin:NAD+ oxidoreductase subunit G